MKMNLPDHWANFMKVFSKKFKDDIVYDTVRVFRTEEEIQERYETYDFEEFLPGYIPVADDSGGQVAVISENSNDTKVYLTSYGVLQENYFEILDRDLLHWMQRRFPFNREQRRTSDAEIELKKEENTALSQKISSYPFIEEFLNKAITIEGIALPENYASAEHIYYFQDGYRYNAVENVDLTGDVEGEFKPSWIVLASNYFADPFFIDLAENKDHFPVYFAWHGQGKWKPVQIAESLPVFQKTLEDIQTRRSDKEALIQYLDENIDQKNPFWKEVYISAEEEEEDDWEATESYESIGVEMSLYITDIGPNKMKVIALLKKELGLSGSDALALSKSPKILFRTGYRKWLEYDLHELEALGVKAELETLA